MKNRFQLRVACSLFAFAALINPLATHAAEETASDEAQAKIDAVKDQAAFEKEVNGLVAQRIEALGLKSDAKGETTLKTKGGEFEGWLLSANAIIQAADTIGAELGSGKYVILAGDEAFDMALPHLLKKQIDVVQNRVSNAVNASSCGVSGGGGVKILGAAALATGAAAVIPYIGAIVSALKTDTEISGFDGPTDARLIINALARNSKDKQWYLPGSVNNPPADGPTITAWTKMEADYLLASACRTGVAKQLAGLDAKDPKKSQLTAEIAALDAAMAGVDKLDAALVMGQDPLLLRAMRMEALATDNTPTNVKVVRVYVEKAGGSILIRKNLFTALGAPAVGITGGAVVGWRVTDPKNGQLFKGGMMSCRTKLTNIGAVHKGQVGKADCKPIS